MPATDALHELLCVAGCFVTKQKGTWDHDQWEAVVGEVGKLGFTLDDEAKRNLGNILEAVKYFYHTAPACCTPKKAPAKKKAAAKK